MVKERELKKAFIDWIDKRIRDKTIATEVGSYSEKGLRIVDILVTNGHTYAFELKSEADNLDRLQDQIDHFIQFYDYVYVVYWKNKFIIDFLPKHVGLIEAFKQNGKIKFKIINKAKINRNINLKYIIDTFWSNELRFVAKEKKIVEDEKAAKRMERSHITNLLLKKCTKTEILKIFRFFMKHRFAIGYQKYKETGDISSFTEFKKFYEYIESIGSLP